MEGSFPPVACVCRTETFSSTDTGKQAGTMVLEAEERRQVVGGYERKMMGRRCTASEGIQCTWTELQAVLEARGELGWQNGNESSASSEGWAR